MNVRNSRKCVLWVGMAAASVLLAVQSNAFAEPIDAKTLTYRQVYLSADVARVESIGKGGFPGSVAGTLRDSLTVQPVSQWGFGYGGYRSRGFGFSVGYGRPYYGGYGYGRHYQGGYGFNRPFYGSYYGWYYSPYRSYGYASSYDPYSYGYAAYRPYAYGYYPAYSYATYQPYSYYQPHIYAGYSYGSYPSYYGYGYAPYACY